MRASGQASRAHLQAIYARGVVRQDSIAMNREEYVRRIVSKSTALLAVGAAAVAAVGGAAGGVTRSAAGAEICVLLPDTASSVRWEHQDKPALIAAFKAAKVSYVIYNADNDAQKQKTQADQCLGNGAKVLIEVMLDSGSASAIEKAAAAKGAK